MSKANEFKDDTEAQRLRMEITKRTKKIQPRKLLTWRVRADFEVASPRRVKPKPLEPRRQLADDLALMLECTLNHPDVDYMSGLLIGLMREGRYVSDETELAQVVGRAAMNRPDFWDGEPEGQYNQRVGTFIIEAIKRYWTKGDKWPQRPRT